MTIACKNTCHILNFGEFYAVYFIYEILKLLEYFLVLEFALNSILIDERLGFSSKGKEQIPRLAIIPPSTPTLKTALSQNGYEVGLTKL